ncbi:urease accessory protein UreF [Virgisporangium aliadipatigenens]|uniref:Urease accessory protein UreF n=1 Tax=Virgisporangium aliadipatigenens TaxID=741659 RepID=A0A8J3YP97_9ACTN|nr:urease accessory UreF family protein [Virgisporangium aliadipatigenens]GIJ47778.1 urease accessory protein UreF [Virgisporangium aliadipatigenens]
MNARTSLLLLADSRLPAGAHAHSGGLEAAVAAGRVTDTHTLRGFLEGRLATSGLVAAAFAAAAVTAATAAAAGGATPGGGVALGGLDGLDLALDARTPSPALRRASRAQGRALMRAGRAMWTLAPCPAAPHQPVALGVVAAAARLDAGDAAFVAAYQSVTGPASAAVRLLGLDPYAVQGVLARLAGDCDDTAARATARAAAGDLPAASAPLLDITAEVHATWEVRLFAS